MFVKLIHPKPAGCIFFLSVAVLVSVAADATKTVSLSSLPASVQKAVQTQVGDGKLGEIQRIEDEGEVSFEVTVSQGEMERSFNLGAAGTLLSMEVELSETPGVVRKTIEAQAGESKLGDIFKTFEDGEIFYDVQMTRNGKDRDFSVAGNGRLESQEVFLSELPPPARKMMKEKIGDGKILRIDEVFEKREGVFPFEVEGRKDGKPFNFSVGPKGRFLGLDE